MLSVKAGYVPVAHMRIARGERFVVSVEEQLDQADALWGLSMSMGESSRDLGLSHSSTILYVFGFLFSRQLVLGWQWVLFGMGGCQMITHWQ